MAYSKQFGERLSEGIGNVALKQGVNKRETEQRIADEMGFSLHAVRRWEKGHVPTQAEQVAFLLRYCITQGRVGRDWAYSLLTHANYPHRNALLEDIFPDIKSDTLKSALRPFSLPARRGDFLGRRSELEWVLETLDSSWPVYLVEGIGGAGKTTLVLEIAYACAG